MENGLTLIQRVAICFTAGVIGGLAVVLFSHVLFELGLSAPFGVRVPISLSPPGIYTPLFWAGLGGILFGLFIKTAWKWVCSLAFYTSSCPCWRCT
jgi:ABC-type antimicrobial peptide transport system permease subunit